MTVVNGNKRTVSKLKWGKFELNYPFRIPYYTHSTDEESEAQTKGTFLPKGCRASS